MMFVEENQANIIAEVIRIFLCCHLKKRSMIFCTSHERARGHAANTISAQDFFMVVNDNKNTFQAHFLGK